MLQHIFRLCRLKTIREVIRTKLGRYLYIVNEPNTFFAKSRNEKSLRDRVPLTLSINFRAPAVVYRGLTASTCDLTASTLRIQIFSLLTIRV